METKNAQTGERTATPEIQEIAYGLQVLISLQEALTNADDDRPDGESRQHGYTLGGLRAASKVLISLLTTTIGGM